MATSSGVFNGFKYFLHRDYDSDPGMDAARRLDPDQLLDLRLGWVRQNDRASNLATPLLAPYPWT